MAAASAERAGGASAASASDDSLIRGFCLGLIVVQNSSLIVVTSYSRTLEPAYLPSVAVSLAEVFKLGAAVLLLVYELGSIRAAAKQIRGLLLEHSSETLMFAVPALCYTLQNNLWYYALSHLDSITAAVTSQMKVITTAIASVFMLGRRLSHLQWVSLCLLTLGMTVMQIRGSHHGERITVAPGRVVPENTIRGASAMLLSTVLSAYAGVFLEKLFKTVKLTLWLQSIQLSVFALPVSCVCMLIHDAPHVLDGSLLVGFNGWAWLTVCLSALGGIAVSMALKYADNILKTFAVGGSIVLNCAVSTAFLGVPLTWQVVCGVFLVVSSTCLFNSSALSRRSAEASEAPSHAEEMELLRDSDHETSLADGAPSKACCGGAGARSNGGSGGSGSTRSSGGSGVSGVELHVDLGRSKEWVALGRCAPSCASPKSGEASPRGTVPAGAPSAHSERV
jgi:UDP-sugar transporter A1/2/3